MPSSVTVRSAPILLAVAVGAGAGCGDAVSPEDAETPAEITVDARALRRHVDILAHDSMCGRPAGTRYERLAAAYVADVFERAGIAPGADDGTYFQDIAIGPGGRDRGAATGTCRADTVVPSRNVIGVVPGTGAYALEWVVVGAHYDHVGWDSAGATAVVLNGADDNASGVSVVLEMARLFRAWVAAHPGAGPGRRSVAFHAYGAEEIGLVGSWTFVAVPPVPLDAVRAMINFDMVGRLRDGTLILGAPAGSPWPGILASVAPETMGYVFSQEFLEQSDQAAFLAVGIPAIHVFTGAHPEYHTPGDDVELLNVDGMRQIAEFGLDLLWDLVTRPDPL